MVSIRGEIERILDKDLPWTITCSCCERDFDLELDFDTATDDLEALIKRLLMRETNDKDKRAT